MDVEAIVEWAATHLEVTPAPLAPYQQAMLRARNLQVVMTPRRPDRNATDLQVAMWLAYLGATGLVTSADQARKVYEHAKASIRA